MASFSFGAGNARKLAALPLYGLGRLATLVIPRGDDWVFGCGAGVGDGALALWDVAAEHGHRAIWLGDARRDAADAARRGIPFASARSPRGFWLTARAGVVVITHGFGDVNRYAITGALVAQLWHGIPLKRIGLDSPETTRLPGPLRRLPGAAGLGRLLGRMYAGAARRITVIPAASHLVRGRLESAFALPDSRVPVTGEPRVDVLSRGDAAVRHRLARAEIDRLAGPLDPEVRLVLYAPTWRDGDRDPAVPSPAEWRRINDLLTRTGAVLLIRSHPLGDGEYEPPEHAERVRALGSDVVADVTPLLPGLDALVTDYSSLAFDSALVPLPVVFLATDLDAYRRRRGFYGTYADVAGTGWATTWADAVDQLDAVLSDPAERDRRRSAARDLSARVHAFRDGGNTRRVYGAIMRRRAALEAARGRG